MVLYVSIILISMVAIGTVDYFLFSQALCLDLPYIVVAVTFSTLSVIVIDLIFALIVRRFLPSHWFAVDKKRFAATDGELRFYEQIGIKKWKDKVIELGALSGFRKNRIAEPNSAEYIKRYIVEANFGIVVHIACILFGFLVIFIYPLKFWYCFGFPVAIVNAALNLLPLFILRYNLPKLHRLYAFNVKRNSI